MTISLRYLVVAGVAVFVVGFIAMFPARAAYHWFAPPDIRLSGITGTLWSGEAREGQVDRLYLKNLEWRVSASALLRGLLRVDLSLSPVGGYLESRVDVSMSGAVLLTDLNAGISLESLRGLLPLNGINGNVRVQLERLSIDQGFPSGAEGTVDVSSLSVQALSRAPIGSYRARFTGAEDGVAGSVEDVDGVFDLAGSIRLDSAGNYALRGLIVPTAEAPADLVRQLQILGSPNERGQREFRLEGSL